MAQIGEGDPTEQGHCGCIEQDPGLSADRSTTLMSLPVGLATDFQPNVQHLRKFKQFDVRATPRLEFDSSDNIPANVPGATITATAEPKRHLIGENRENVVGRTKTNRR